MDSGLNTFRVEARSQFGPLIAKDGIDMVNMAAATSFGRKLQGCFPLSMGVIGLANV